MSTTDSTAQAGWYAVGGGRERYWDGRDWTDRLRPVPTSAGFVSHDDMVSGLAPFHAPAEFTAN